MCCKKNFKNTMYFWNMVLRLCNLKIANMRDNIMVTVPITLRVDYSTAAHQDGSFFIPMKGITLWQQI